MTYPGFDPTNAESVLHAAVEALYSSGIISSPEAMDHSDYPGVAWAVHQTPHDAVKILVGIYDDNEAGEGCPAGWSITVTTESSKATFSAESFDGDTMNSFIEQALAVLGRH